MAAYSGPRDDRGLPHGRGELLVPGAFDYKGSFSHGTFHGRGTMTRWYRGAVAFEYTGQFVAGKRHGVGSVTLPLRREKYEGDWRDDEMCGIGTHEGPTGTYTGDMERGKFHGFGTLARADNTGYRGLWADGVFHGPGRLVDADGATHDGQWIRGVQQGRSTVTRLTGQKMRREVVDGRVVSEVVISSPSTALLLTCVSLDLPRPTLAQLLGPEHSPELSLDSVVSDDPPVGLGVIRHSC